MSLAYAHAHGIGFGKDKLRSVRTATRVSGREARLQGC